VLGSGGFQHLLWLTQDWCVKWVLVGAWGAAGIGFVLRVSMNSGFVSVVDCLGMRLLLSRHATIIIISFPNSPPLKRTRYSC
jgi:hypothetical protein